VSGGADPRPSIALGDALAASDPAAYKRRVAASFDGTDWGYGTGGDFHERLAVRLVVASGVAPGQVVLDVATGTGPVAIAAARAVGPDGRVVGVDLSSGRLALARRNVSAAALANVDLLLGDAERLCFPGDTFDVVLCSSSLAWLPDPRGALAEWRRVARPGGIVGFSCFAETAFPTSALLRAALRTEGVALPDLNAPLGTPTRCRALCAAAGLGVVESHGEQFGRWVGDPAASWEAVWAGNAGRFGIVLSPVALARVRAAYVAAFAEAATDRGLWDDATVLFVVARR